MLCVFNTVSVRALRGEAGLPGTARSPLPSAGSPRGRASVSGGRPLGLPRRIAPLLVQGRLLWVCVGCYSACLPGEESASTLNTPDCREQHAADDSTAASRVTSSARQRRGSGAVSCLHPLCLIAASQGVVHTRRLHGLQAPFAWHTWMALDQFPGVTVEVSQ